VLLTNLEKVSQRRPGIDYFQAPPIKTTNDYSDLLLTGIGQYVDSSHVLIIQWDSFVTHPELWGNEFLSYDYIGPVWPHHPETPVGNGGFSLRSKKLLDIIKEPGFVKKHPEDYCICADNREFLDLHKIKIAPVSIAEQFAVERTLWHKAFGFHGFFNFARVLNDDELKIFINILPKNYLSGLDAYELIDSLRRQGRISLAKEIAEKVRFTWKMRKQFLDLRYWQLITAI
jgi:hypothetical protein